MPLSGSIAFFYLGEEKDVNKYVIRVMMLLRWPGF